MFFEISLEQGGPGVAQDVVAGGHVSVTARDLEKWFLGTALMGND
jgi:hypothetical protein